MRTVTPNKPELQAGERLERGTMSNKLETQEETRQRVQLDFTPEAYQRLLEVRRMAEARTNAEVVRNALRLYEWFLIQRQEGFHLQITKEGVVREVELMF